MLRESLGNFMHSASTGVSCCQRIFLGKASFEIPCFGRVGIQPKSPITIWVLDWREALAASEFRKHKAEILFRGVRLTSPNQDRRRVS